MFRSGSKYYLWNPIEGGIWEMDITTEIDKLRCVYRAAKERYGGVLEALVY